MGVTRKVVKQDTPRFYGTAVFDNNLYIQQKDSGGTARNILGQGSDNILKLGFQAAPPSAGDLVFFANGAESARFAPSSIFQFADGLNITTGTTTGTKIGTSTSQKLSFFNATPIVQPSSTTDLRTALINLGLYATGGASPLNLNGGFLQAGFASFTNTVTVDNGIAYSGKDTAGNGKTLMAAGTDNTARVGFQQAPASNGHLIMYANGVEYARIGPTGRFDLTDGVNFQTGSTTGTKFGNATTQKVGFFGTTPIVQPANTTDLRTALINLGLYATGGASPLNLNGGLLTAGSSLISATGTAIDSTPSLSYISKSSTFSEQMLRLRLNYFSGAVTNYQPLDLECDYRSTEAVDPFIQTYSGFNSLIYYGSQTFGAEAAAKGTLVSMAPGLIVRNSGEHEDEHAPMLAYLRYDTNNNGFINTTPGRAWMLDMSVHGAIGQQQSALGGAHMFLNNHYNGAPRDGSSGAFWAVTGESSGGAQEAYHRAAPTYQLGVGFGVVGVSSGSLTRGWELGVQVGGSGSSWNKALSHIGTGIDVADYDSFGILVRQMYTGVMKIALTAGGTGYTSQPTVGFTAAPTGGTTAGCISVLTPTSIASVTLTTGGSGYGTTPPTVTFSDPTPSGQPAQAVATLSGGVVTGITFGSGATGTATVSGGGITAVSVTAGGSGYPASQAAMPITFVQSGIITAWGTAVTNSSGVITAFTVTRAGTGYTAGAVTTSVNAANYTLNPTVTFSAPTSGVTAKGTVNLTATSVAGLRMYNPGRGYTTAPTVTFSGGGGGTGANATTTIGSSGGVVDCYITNAGSGYSTIFPPTITFSGGGGSGAAGSAVISITGQITGIFMTDAGSGYTSPPTVAIAAPAPVTATGTATVAGNVVTGVTVTNAGTGYYTSVPTVTFSGGGGTGATATAVVYFGIVKYVTIIDPGTGYTSTPTVAFSAPAAGTTATAQATLGRTGIAIDADGGPLVVGGRTTTAKFDVIGSRAQSNGTFAATDDARSTEYILRGSSTSATAVTLTLDGATPAAGNRIVLATGKSYAFVAECTARQDSGVGYAFHGRRGIIKNNAGTVSLSGTVAAVGTDIESVAGYDTAITADNTNKAIQIAVTGAASTNLRWVCYLRMVEIGYGS